MSGSPVAFRDVLDKMINGGNIAMLGIMPDDTGINWTDVVFKGLNIKGIYGREMHETWYKMVMMIQSGLPVERIITHRLPHRISRGLRHYALWAIGQNHLDWKTDRAPSGKSQLADEIAGIKEAGLWKTERVIASDQKNDITLADGSKVVNMCANNYLGLANHPDVMKAARQFEHQFRLASVGSFVAPRGS